MMIEALSATLWQWLWNGSIAALLIGLPLLLWQSLLHRRLPPGLLYLAWSLLFLRLLLPGSWLITTEAVDSSPLAALSAPTPQAPWLLLWAAGVVVLAGLMLAANIRCRRRLLAACEDLSEQDRRQFAVPLQRRLKLRAGPRILVAADNHPAMMLGLLRPLIVLPASWQDQTRREKELLLLHELCHYRRIDHWQWALVLALQVLFWFHPVVWLAARRFKQLQEIHCDRLVLRQSDASSPDYQRLLLTQLAVNVQPQGLSGFNFGGHSTLQRVQLLRQPIRWQWPRKLLATAVFALLLGCSLFAPPPTAAGWLAAQDPQQLPGSISKRYSVLARMSQQESTHN